MLISLMMVGQMTLPTIVLAHEGDPTPSPSAAPSSSPSPEASPSVSPSPQASPSPSATPAPSPSPSASPEPKRKYSDHDDLGCYGAIPVWVKDVAAKRWVEADQASFACDKATGYYLSPKYNFNTHSGIYTTIPAPVPSGSPVAAAAEPQPDYIITAPNVVHTVLGDLTIGSPDYNMAKSLGLLDGPDGIAVGATGPGSTTQAGVDNSSQSWLDLTSLVNVISTLQSNATSGNVDAAKNTQVGDAVTGAASVIANIINLLASAWSWSNGNLNFFMQNFGLDGKDHTGDVTLTPTETQTGGGGTMGAQLGVTGPDSTNTANLDNSTTLDVNAKSTGNIINNIDVAAQSGNANATKNTSTGDVASGDALAQVNIINLINSFITSGSSFFGILNMYGAFNGDILFPTGFLNGAVASDPAASGVSVGSTGPDSANNAGIDNSSQTNLNTATSNAVTNNVQTTAATGSATTNGNTLVGDVATGTASTEQGLFNLSNKSIFGDNAVLVIVNVLGHWVGKIMGVSGVGNTRSALLTGNAQVADAPTAQGQIGIGSTGPNSSNAAAIDNSQTTNVNQASVGTITNNVNVSAKSGDAAATRNTQVGDVTTGDAHASSGIANIFNTIMNVKRWFGVLVINVFGDMVGDVGTDTVAGGTPNATATPPKGITATPVAADDPVVPAVGLVGLVMGMSQASHQVQAVSGQAAGLAEANQTGQGQVLTAAAHQPADHKVAAANTKDMSILFLVSALVMMVAGALASIEKKLKRH